MEFTGTATSSVRERAHPMDAAHPTRTESVEVGQYSPHGMRGTVLLIDMDKLLPVAVDLFRTSGLIVYHCDELSQALKQFRDIGADVVLVASTHYNSSVIRAFRALADDATSVIVASGPEYREEARAAGAYSFLLNLAPPADLLYEIHRALILRRSGRRLPWHW